MWRDKLLKFLKSSTHYKPDRLLTHFPSNQVRLQIFLCDEKLKCRKTNCLIAHDCLYHNQLYPFSSQFFEERAILLGRSGRHEDALAIYVVVLNDLVEAEAYCERVINAPDASTDAKQVFLHLLRLYLDPQSGSPWKTIFCLASI